MEPFPTAEGIAPIAIPFPGESSLITANIYALGKGPITLIDAGPKFPGLVEMVAKNLAARGLNLAEVDRIIFTHGHVDHFGLAAKLIKAIGHPVRCYIHADDSQRLTRQSIEQGFWNREEKEFMERMGVPLERLSDLIARFSAIHTLCDPVEEVELMEEGREFSGEGYNLRVVHTPGHSPGSCCLYETEQKILFSGDHVIKHITPNPLVELRPERLGGREYRSLAEYIDSLNKINELDVRWVFPGHGEFIDELADITERYHRHHRQRMAALVRLLEEGPQSVFGLIKGIFPGLGDQELFLAASDILAHLEILEQQGRVASAEPGPPQLFRLA